MTAQRVGRGPHRRRNVHSSMRRFTRIVIRRRIRGLCRGAAVCDLRIPAVEADPAGVCVFSVLPNPVPVGGGHRPHRRHRAGRMPRSPHSTSPATRPIRRSSPPPPLMEAETSAAPTSPSPPPRDISANLHASTTATTPPVAPNPEGLPRRAGPSPVVAASADSQRQALAFTGLNNTTSFVLIGVTALIVGIVLTVGARRRGRVPS